MADWDEIEAMTQVPGKKGDAVSESASVPSATLAEAAERRTEVQMEHKQRLAMRGQVAKAEKGMVNKLIHAFGGEAAVLDELGSGATIDGLSRRLGFSASSFYDWVDRGGQARADAVARARARGAHSLAESTVDIADDLVGAESNVEVQVAKLRSDNRWRLAAKLNPDAYGEKQAQININLGDIALSALRKREVIDVEDVKPVNGLDDDGIQ